MLLYNICVQLIGGSFFSLLIWIAVAFLIHTLGKTLSDLGLVLIGIGFVMLILFPVVSLIQAVTLFVFGVLLIKKGGKLKDLAYYMIILNLLIFFLGWGAYAVKFCVIFESFIPPQVSPPMNSTINMSI